MSPGVSAVPASALPSITVSPPNVSACTSAPWRLTPPSAMSGTRPSAAARHSASACTCGHAEVRVQPGGAAAARSDPDLDAVDALIEQEAHAVRGRDVAGDQLDVAEAFPERLDRARHDGRMTVRDVDDDDVDLGAKELRGALQIVALRADRRADAQPAVRVARRERKLPLRDEILGGDQSAQRAVGVQQRKLLDLAASASSLPPARFRARRCARPGDRAASCATRPSRA